MKSTRHVLNGIIPQASVNVCIANYLEQHVACVFRKSQSAIAGHKIAELMDADIHTLVCYLRKRIPCTCLDKKYKEVKHVKKTGECCNPHCSLPENRAERSKMFCCSRCRRATIVHVHVRKLHGQSTRRFEMRLQLSTLILMPTK